MYDFGPLAANDDPRILDYFHTTNQISELLANPESKRSFLIVARPGGGKTALVTWLKNGPNSKRVITIDSSVARFLIDNDSIATHEDQSLFFSSELYRILFSKVIAKEDVSESLRSECNDYLNSIYEALKKTLGKVNSISFAGFGFSLKPEEKRSYLDIIRKEQKITKAKPIIQRIAKEQKFILSIDNPESIVGKGLNVVTTENGIRIGSFFSSLAELKNLGIQVIVFVKEHIMQLVLNSFSDASHFKDQILSLEWTEKDLIELINLRVEKRISSNWENVFDITKDEFKRLVFPNLINGPRDLISVCNRAGDGKGRITSHDLKQGINNLRNDKWREIQLEFINQWPGVDQFSRVIIEIINKEISSKEFTKDQFINVIKNEFEKPDTALNQLRKKEDWINSALLDPPPVDERMFIIGVLGYIHDKTKYYPWSGQSVDRYRLANKVFISSLFS